MDSITPDTGMTATYSAEDNKLRLYADVRLDDETYNRVKAAGFKWAPKQGLFVAPMWTPIREDFCLALAGEITAEQTTLVERAEAKADRLDDLAYRRLEQSNAFHRAANAISERFAMGQPILVGHHSERQARRDQVRMDSALNNAVKAANAVDYWGWKAEGVERHANRKAAPGVRARRIKTLLAELRDRQRDINHAYICLELWNGIKSGTDAGLFASRVEHYAGAYLKTGAAAPYYKGDSLWSLLRNNEITPLEVVDICLQHHERQATSRHTSRWISHILNRLAFERSELGDVTHFEGAITATILQAFAREHGAYKPKAVREGDRWALSSAVPLPLHVGDGKTLVLTGAQWVELMAACGYEVPVAKPKKPPILNFPANDIQGHSWGGLRIFRQIKLTKKEYSAIYSDYRGVKLSKCGQFRFKVCKHPEQRGYDAEWVAVLLTDSKQHPAPQSDAFTTTASEAS